MAVILVVFLYTFYIAKGAESGYEYEVTDGNYRSSSDIVLAIVSLGVNKIMLLCGSLFLLASFSRILKIRNNSSIHRLLMVRKIIL